MSLFHGTLKFNNFPIWRPTLENFGHKVKNCLNYWCPKEYDCMIWFSEVIIEIPRKPSWRCEKVLHSCLTSSQSVHAVS